MRIVHDLAQACPTSRSYVTIGVFDGVHRGHQELVAAMVEAAHLTVQLDGVRPSLTSSPHGEAHNVAIVLTFDPHPAITLGYEPPPLLTTVEERIELLAALGLDILVVLPFTPAIARTPATDFIELLIHHLHLAELWGGPDFALGYRREGNVSFLQRLGAEWGFTMHTVGPLTWEGLPVSSSRVRVALKEGDIHQATGCLGRPYRLTGVVARRSEHGRGLSRRTGVPTASLSSPPERLIPAGGVYACLAHTEHLGTHPAAVNIDTCSTSAGRTLVAEAHLLDFDANLYGQTLSLDFIARLQDGPPFLTPRQIADCRLRIADWLGEAS